MSRLGKKPIEVPKETKVICKDGVLHVEGPKGKLQYPMPDKIVCDQKDNKVFFTARENSKVARMLHGTTRSIVMNMITGVTQGFTKTLLIEGVGYKAQVQGKVLKLTVGFSHPVEYAIPDGVKVDAGKQVEVSVSGMDKALVGQVAAEIRDVWPVEPYKGKGIRYSDEKVRRKVGKAVTK